jgi:hypothetical protein
MASGGSTLFSLTWSDAVTPSGRRICALRASVRPTSDSGYTSWPTPTVSRGDYSYANGNHETPTLKLSGAAKTALHPSESGEQTDRLSPWPTPAARDWKSSASNQHERNARPLNEVARLSAWSTPLANGAAGGGSERHIDGRRSNLRDQVFLSHWATPVAGDSQGGGAPTFAHGGRDLKNMVKTASWATPAAQEAGGTPERFLERKQQTKESGTPIGVSLTSLSLQAQLVDSGQTPSGSSAEIPVEARRSPGQLNPDLSRWLQGYPDEWAFCGAMAIRSSRK